jgi:hypothetical protein
LRPAVVINPGPETCEVFREGRTTPVRYSAPFQPRAAELRPGHLVALAPRLDGPDLVVWRWFDAVVLRTQETRVHLFEPAHGDVLARPRRPDRQYRTGSRAYLSAGLPGADWWVAGPADVPAEEADVELDDVRRFFVDHGLWERLT